MESAGHEHLESLVKALTEAPGQEGRPAPKDAKDADWVIERIQDSFDSRAR